MSEKRFKNWEHYWNGCEADDLFTATPPRPLAAPLVGDGNAASPLACVDDGSEDELSVCRTVWEHIRFLAHWGQGTPAPDPTNPILQWDPARHRYRADPAHRTDYAGLRIERHPWGWDVTAYANEPSSCWDGVGRGATLAEAMDELNRRG